ncbi:MAG: bifunctional folylpolyglutamate synthase/dihydrofolate synthase [Verrucomicrobia bacterium]|nr:MAG: bifunctional folylpolyglutamate synthase/dihydrofolate synthase [Verrucomicrobiota bacterium]
MNSILFDKVKDKVKDKVEGGRTYRDAIQFLYKLRWFGAKLGLRNTLRLAEMAGNPHQRLRFIHVAGTNGKGSTCAMLESIYRAAGLRVGLFTSPHLVSFSERIQVNREPIPDAEVVRLLRKLRPWLKRFPTSEHPTFFEVVTVMGLMYFEEQKCDLVIWETGLGGRLDATNIVTPLASIITNIHYDHQKWLGKTLESIATEKAGIIKPGVSVITATDAPEALRVIKRTARQKHAPMIVVSGGRKRLEQEETEKTEKKTLFPLFTPVKNLSLWGKHQQLNAAVAVATVRALESKLPVGATAIRTGLSSVHWPGRLQLVLKPKGQKILLDGAHNIAGAKVLRVALRSVVSGPWSVVSSQQSVVSSQWSVVSSQWSGLGRQVPRVTLILGVLEDKDWAGMCKILAPLAKRILLVTVQSERSAAPEKLAGACRRANPRAEVLACPSLRAALADAATDPFVVITGSLYLVGEAMELLGISAAKATDERGLNEWQAGQQQTPNAKHLHKHQTPDAKQQRNSKQQISNRVRRSFQ